LSGYKKNAALQEKNGHEDSIGDTLIISVADDICANKKKPFHELASLEKEEKKLLAEKKQLLETLDQLQSKFDILFDKRSRLFVEMERNLASKPQKSVSESSHKLFSIITWGPSWNDGLVFTVIAENDVWAKEVVRQWLISNGRETHRIDKVLALVSQDVRAIVNVGALLLDV